MFFILVSRPLMNS